MDAGKKGSRVWGSEGPKSQGRNTSNPGGIVIKERKSLATKRSDTGDTGI